MAEKTQYEKAVDEFVEADQHYAELEESFTSGLILRQLLLPGVTIEQVIDEFKLVIEEMKKLLDERNSKLVSAKNALRAAVQLTPSQWRGPEGKPTMLSYGPFSVSSVTRRGLDGKTLLSLAKKRGFDAELAKLTGIDKDGRSYSLVETNVDVDYEQVLLWLKQHGHNDVIEASYDEREVTPAVKGPKPIAFIGEKLKDGSGYP